MVFRPAVSPSPSWSTSTNTSVSNLPLTFGYNIIKIFSFFYTCVVHYNSTYFSVRHYSDISWRNIVVRHEEVHRCMYIQLLNLTAALEYSDYVPGSLHHALFCHSTLPDFSHE